MLDLFEGQLTYSEIVNMTIPEMKMLYEARIEALKKKTEAELAARKLEKESKRW